jgi:hypothetical protein
MTGKKIGCHHKGTNAEGSGVFPDTNALAWTMMAWVGNDGSGAQASHPAINTFTTANTTSGLAGPSTMAHTSFVFVTPAAHCGAPPFFNATGGPPSISSLTNPMTPIGSSPLSHFASIDRCPGIRWGTWSPASLGLPSDIR